MHYEPRESINPRAFALRHALLEELKHRRGIIGDHAQRAACAALARVLDVTYEAATRMFVVRGTHGAESRVPLDAFRVYEPRTDALGASWRRDDEVLRENRVLAARLVNALLDRAPYEAP